NVLKKEIDDLPLSAKIRPRNLEDFVGQEHILGANTLLKRSIESDRISSIIFHGPPGSGKTALALIIAEKTKSFFERINAVTSGVADIHKNIQKAKERRQLYSKKTILFIDEIHRFNKLQQDALLPDVENGIIILIGATVENPYFYINSALLSRTNIFQFNSLTDKNIETILNKSLENKEFGLGQYKVNLHKESLNHLVKYSNGDARKALNALEIGVLTTLPNENNEIDFTLHIAEESIQKKSLQYDKDGDMHYDIISAFIKSMRGSNPDASLYWLAKMLHCGEDPLFIARRIVICAAEDVGNADPMALVLANATLQVIKFIGMPEARIPLAQAVIYVATAPKSNSAYLAITEALNEVKENKSRPVPDHLRNTDYKKETLDNEQNYKYPHDYPFHFVSQEYMPDFKQFYFPTNLGFEKTIKERLEYWEKRIKENK
ncbi:MAG: replication-associated recombination protein A, partial [bacterium]